MSHDQENDGMCCEQVTLYDSQYERELIRDWKMIERRMEEVNIEIAKKKRELRQHRIKMWREQQLVDLFESNDVREGFGQGGLSTCQDSNVLCTKMGEIIVNPYVRKVGHKEVVVNNPYAKKNNIRRGNNCTSLDNSGTRISKTERNNGGGLDVGLKKVGNSYECEFGKAQG
jgi:hypothetical protein